MTMLACGLLAAALGVQANTVQVEKETGLAGTCGVGKTAQSGQEGWTAIEKSSFQLLQLSFNLANVDVWLQQDVPTFQGSRRI
eukprot:CAMPEP_0115053182 /NCGR_PEP_ID=MMETSP0227-20121206/3362_1 /TAXON_ID=89957 /ORGANISM="Polarella glacialis, Strain CCMP 1383" /LENGTH=82 /DNA_ID=CAMNT_0002437449 /DNA_START=127 /DNA_END=375 /DNA_ORIENTATION=-